MDTIADRLTELKFYHKIDMSGGPNACWELKNTATCKGYCVVQWNTKLHYAHRVTYTLIHGQIPHNLLILHSCDNPPCVNPRHLRAGTALDNAQDMVSRGRHGSTVRRESRPRGEAHHSQRIPECLARGEQHGRTKFTWDIVDAIRLESVNGCSSRKLGLKYGVSHTAIRQIVKNLVWIKR